MIAENDIKREHVLGLLQGAIEIAHILANMSWLLGINHTEKCFWTSDEPVNLYSPTDSRELGLLRPSTQVYLPLSPTLGLVLYHPRQNYPPIATTEVILAHVTYYNTLQVQRSRRFLFSVNQDFELARQFVEKHPEYCNPNRQRMHFR